MKLYHYSTLPFTKLKTRKASGKCSEEEIEQDLVYAKRIQSPGPYNESLSFFFDPVPLKLLGKLFRNANDFWFPGNVIYEHIVETESLKEPLIYFISDTPTDTKTLDETTWVETEEFEINYLREKNKRKRNTKEIGTIRQDLENQIKKYVNKTAIFYQEASKRIDFNDYVKMYAAFVPHVILYPMNGEVTVVTINKCTVGYDSRKPFQGVLHPAFLDWKN